MDKRCGLGRPYIREAKLREHAAVCTEAAIAQFRSIASIGSAAEIRRFEQLLEEEIAEKLNEYVDANKNRDPFRNLELYAIPMVVACGSYVVRVFTDLVCFEPLTPEFDWEYGDVCRGASEMWTHVYVVIFTVLGMITVATGHGAWERIQDILGLLFGTTRNGNGTAGDVVPGGNSASATAKHNKNKLD